MSDAHLTREEIDNLLAALRESQTSNARSVDHDRSEHAANCSLCQDRMKAHDEALRCLDAISLSGDAVKGVHCPDEAVWVKLAAGLNEEGEAAQYANHAMTCDYCGGKLREAIQDFMQPVSTDEQNFFDSLRVSDPAWQDSMAGQMAAAARPEPVRVQPSKRIFTFPRAVAVAASALFAVAAWWWSADRTLRPPDQLLLQAYTAQRTVELRLGNARYAPPHVRRGPQESSSNKALPLIEAEAVIIRGLKQHPEDTSWLQAKGRADLLEWNFESAIYSLRRALQAQPNSSDLSIDLASAYFERAEATGHDLDYSSALELLTQVLRTDPGNTVALFNRAIIDERMLLYNDAIHDWESYLQLDSNGEWSVEGRKRLDEIKKKTNRS